MSARKLHEQKLLRILISLHERYPAAGLDTLAAMIRKECPCSRNTVHRLMKLYNIHSIRKRAFKITTNSKHNYAVCSKSLGAAIMLGKIAACQLVNCTNKNFCVF
ncbi:IS3 family transposase [Qingrenia yutianensis]|uniref:IS3 family transposase n=1 Tax=Qingrenia yutianensis TaxID=2763676 RepID=UPI0037435124